MFYFIPTFEEMLLCLCKYIIITILMGDGHEEFATETLFQLESPVTMNKPDV